MMLVVFLLAWVLSFVAGIAVFAVLGAVSGGVALLSVAAAAFTPWLISAVVIDTPIVSLMRRLAPRWPSYVIAILGVPLAIVPTALFNLLWSGHPRLPSFARGIDIMLFAMFAVAGVVFLWAARELDVKSEP